MSRHHLESLVFDRIRRLRAPILSAIDGIVSIASLTAGVAAAEPAPVGKAVLRVTFWGAFAVAATTAIGWLFGTSVD